MADRERENFEVVRRGYDIDQVEQFLVRQAEAWRTELFDARRRIGQLETDLTKLSTLEQEVEQSRQQQDALTMTLQSATQTRDEMLAQAAEDSSAKLAEAEAAAAQIPADAENEATGIRSQGRQQTDKQLIAQEEEFRQRGEQLQHAHLEAKSRYEMIEATLVSKIQDLNDMREALVSGLEAIATGGLTAMEDIGDAMAGVGLLDAGQTTAAELPDSPEAPSPGVPPMPSGSMSLPTKVEAEDQPSPAETTDSTDSTVSDYSGDRTAGNTYGADSNGSATSRNGSDTKAGDVEETEPAPLEPNEYDLYESPEILESSDGYDSETVETAET